MAHGQPPGTSVLRARQQPPTHHVQIRQAAADEQPVGIFRQPTVPDFGPPEDPLDHQERMFDLRPHLRFRPIPRPLVLTQGPMARGFGLDEALGPGRVLSDHIALSAMGGIAPHPRLLAMQ